ncbi:MAG: M28 family peptidase [Bacteroidetes bacterium]|nr:MAG: M28 family peptidase [Bacteroidota bacterium]
MSFFHKYNSIARVAGLLLLTFCTGFFEPASGQKRKAKARAAQNSMDMLVQNLQKHVGILAADSLEGRRTGTAGEQKAIAYLKSQYEALGIPPASTKGGYFLPFEVNEGKSWGSSTLMINQQKLKIGSDFFPMVWSANGAIDKQTALALNEGGNPWWHDVKEDIDANAQNPHFLLEEHLKLVAKKAAAKGATALLLYNSGTVADSLAFNKNDRVQPVSIPVIYVKNKAYLSEASVAHELLYVVAQVTVETKQRTGYNVAAYIDNGAEKTVVLGAHFDHLGYGEDENSRHTGAPAIHNGADDNASGTAALLELARILKTQPVAGINILLVHFSGEELGLFGSKHFADHSPVPTSTMLAMINMDMVGRLNDSTRVLTVGGVGTAPAWPTLMNTAAHPEFVFKIDSSGTGPSDHTSFYRKNIPVLFFFTGLHTDYHKPSDDAQLLNYKGQAQIVNYIEQIVRGIPAQQSNLVFTKTREQSMGTGRFKVSMGIMPDYTYAGTGVRADGIIEGRAAQKAGLQTGDIIVQLGEFLVNSVETYMQALNRFEKGQATTVTIKRGSDLKELPLTF